MTKQIKNLIILILGLILLVLMGYIFYLHSSKQQISNNILESVKIQNTILYNSVILSMTNDGNTIENIKIYRRDPEKPFFLFDSISLPVFMIVIPPSEAACGLCVDYVIDSAKDFFPDFSDNSRLVIFSHQPDSRLKSKIDKKDVFHCALDNCKLGLYSGQDSGPFYVIINADRRANMFFVPNNLMPELTDRYLKIVKEKYFTEKFSLQ